jgi:hypothetical protein
MTHHPPGENGEPQGQPAGATPVAPGIPPSGTSRTLLFIVAGGVVVVVIAVVAFLLLRGDDHNGSGAKTPQDAVKALLNAGMSGNKNRAYSVLCDNDRALAGQNPVLQDGRIRQYTIRASRRTDDSHAIVTARFSTTATRGQSQYDFPVTKSGGRWKVCVSDEFKNLPTSLST